MGPADYLQIVKDTHHATTTVHSPELLDSSTSETASASATAPCPGGENCAEVSDNYYKIIEFQQKFVNGCNLNGCWGREIHL